MSKTLNVKSSQGRKVVVPVQFEGSVQDSDSFRFFVAQAYNICYSGGHECKTGLLIGFGDDDYLDPEKPYVSPAFAILPGEDLKVKAAQLRELADWFDSQAE